MKTASFRVRSELSGTKPFKSIIRPFSHRKACSTKSVHAGADAESPDPPTTCPLELMASAVLHELPGKVPRLVIAPFRHRNASWA